MALLADYAITPDVFDATSYSSEEVCAARLETIREAMLEEGLVRDLRNGRWRALFGSDGRAWHGRGKELVKKLATQGRLIPHQPLLPREPQDDMDWCAEALATHDQEALRGGVIVTEAVKHAYADQPLVARIDRLSSATWWASRGPSVKVARTLSDYLGHLDPILRCANSVMFIDPHVNPTRHGYQDLVQLLTKLGNRKPVPMVEIHRVCYEGSGPSRRFPLNEDRAYFSDRFRAALSDRLRAAGLRVEVFVWDDFHDRFLISNLIGISLANGFDIGGAHADTYWTRLSRNDRDRVQRDFDEASGRHKLHDRFSLP
ncbi:MAG: hypothetical protein OXP28_04215 [Gammaproteobacteria bacterium]|nr:hypothetical protein [Gammaproteobacteria bacterium]MDE0451279.1 hypothetical protein [Gammaproteobacteria bacterium]